MTYRPTQCLQNSSPACNLEIESETNVPVKYKLAPSTQKSHITFSLKRF